MQVLQVAQPFQGQGPVGPGDVACQVGAVGLGEGGEVVADRQLLPQVEDRVQQLGEGVVLEEGRVFQEPEEKLLFPVQEVAQRRIRRKSSAPGSLPGASVSRSSPARGSRRAKASRNSVPASLKKRPIIILILCWRARRSLRDTRPSTAVAKTETNVPTPPMMIRTAISLPAPVAGAISP